MKPPRVFIKSGHYYLRYHIPGQKNAIDKATRLVADNPDWKKSKHVKLIRIAIRKAEEERFERLSGKFYAEAARITRISWWDLLAEYNEVNCIDAGKQRAKPTLIHREYSVRFLERLRPKLTPNTITRQDVLALREETLTTFARATIKGYFAELKILLDYAVRKKYIESNPFEKVLITVPRKAPRATSVESEKKLLSFLYWKRRDLYHQALFQRLTGLRAKDVCDLEWRHVKDVLDYWNSKGKREEEFPITPALRYLLDQLPRTDKFVFTFRRPDTVRQYLERGCAFVGVDRIGTHQLKRNYLVECAKAKPDVRTFDLLAHHVASVNILAVDHYSGRDLLAMAEILEKVQGHWLEFQQNIPALEDERVYSFANSKGIGRTKVA